MTARILGAPAVLNCATCHPRESARFAGSAMGNSLGAPLPAPDGRVIHARSGSVLEVHSSNGRMIQSIVEGGNQAQYPIRYQVGADMIGRSYLIQIGAYILQSPISWYKAYGWDVSPGYASAPAIDFDRPVSADCLFCHSGNAKFEGADQRRLAVPALQPIGCERCHGSGDAHMRHPTAANIVNPPKLPVAKRDSVCEQCHLEGVARVLNPGKTWADFRAGLATEEVFATYVKKNPDGKDTVAVTHAEQLAQSMCARASGGRLWCGTCHDPHGESKVRAQEVAQICSSCHARLSSTHVQNPTECISCHMPRIATVDIAHAAITDHRILRRPSEAADAVNDADQTVVPWRVPAPQVRDRDLGLAELVAALTERSDPLLSDATRRLESIPEPSRQNDPAVLSDLEVLFLQQGKFDLAIAAGRRATELQPGSAAAAEHFGRVLEEAGEVREAEQQFQHAFNLDPSLRPAYVDLAKLYQSQGRAKEAKDTIDRYLMWNPLDIQFRSLESQGF